MARTSYGTLGMLLVLGSLAAACGPGQAPDAEDGGSGTSGDGDGDGDGDSGDSDSGDGDGDGGDGDGDSGDGDGDPASSCGDGQLDPGEACDDGNPEAGDGCSPACQLSGGALLDRYEAEPSWPAELLLLTHASTPEPALVLVGRTNGDNPFDNEVVAVSLTADGEPRWSTVLPPFELLPVAGHLPMGLETIAGEGAAWISGWVYTEDIQVDVPGGMWLARVDSEGSWEWTKLSEQGVQPLATVMRDDQGAAILEYVGSLGGESNSLLLFDSAGALEAASYLPELINPYRIATGLALAPEGALVSVGYSWTSEQVEPDMWEMVAEDLWLADFDSQGELLDQRTLQPPGGLWARAEQITRDPETGTYAVLVREREAQASPTRVAWARLDANAESILAWYSLYLGNPIGIEPDGQGGAYVLGETSGFVLSHYGPDPDEPPLWSVSHPRTPRDFAIDESAGRAYVLTSSSVDVLQLD